MCNGHGSCDIEKRDCECDDGFGGDGCEIVFEVFSYDTVLVAIWSFLFSICIIVLVVSILWLYKNQHYKTIKALSPRLTVLMTVGMILLCVGTILYLAHPLTGYVSLCLLLNILLTHVHLYPI